MTIRRVAPLGLLLALTSLAPAAPDVGRSYQVPYRLTLTNHYLVRVKINGKGPFNFLVDTGAPALYVGTEAARAIGLEPSKTDYFTPVDRLDLEGGATLVDLKGRVEDPFQLVGMNALGLPGAKIDGILGFSILARFRMEFDPTRDRMTWTRLDHDPQDPFVPFLEKDRAAPVEVQAMNALGPVMKLMSLFVGKQPEDVLQPQGLLGIELGEGLSVKAVLPDSPAARAGIEPGDVILRLRDLDVDAPKTAHAAIAPIRPGDEVRATIARRGERLEILLRAADGF